MALGYELYASCALNLAMSIKAYEPTANITLIHDDSIKNLTPEELSFFDILKPVNESDFIVGGTRQYQRLKLCVDKYSDYDCTLYIDVDTIWFPKKEINQLFYGLKDKPFVIGTNGFYNPKTRAKTSLNYTYWGNQEEIARYFQLINPLPQTISGVFYFEKCDLTRDIFSTARKIYNDPNCPHIKWANGKPDEYCFNVALSQLDYMNDETHFVYFDKVNGAMNNDKIYQYFWGAAAGGNKLQPQIRRLYNDLVDLYSNHFGIKKHYHVDKKTIIPERNSNV